MYQWLKAKGFVHGHVKEPLLMVQSIEKNFTLLSASVFYVPDNLKRIIILVVYDWG